MTTISERHAAAGHEPVDIPAQEPQSEAHAGQLDSSISPAGGGISPHRSRWMAPEATEMAPAVLGVASCGHAIHGEVAPTTGPHSEAGTAGRMTRSKCLDAARAAVIGDREYSHGAPEDVFPMIAKFWSAYLGVAVVDYDVSAMMVLLKVARISQNPKNPDSWVDVAGYSAYGAELAP